MANRDNLGFRPAVPNPDKVRRFAVTAAGNPTLNLFVGSAVKPEATGGILPLAAGDTALALGVVVGVYDSNGVPCGAPGSSVSTKYLPLATAGYADVHICLPGEQFIGQSQTGTSYASTDVFAGVNIVATAGNTTTARSAHELGATGGTDCIILGKVNEPGNDWGVNVDVYFSFLNSFWGQVNPTAGV